VDSVSSVKSTIAQELGIREKSETRVKTNCRTKIYVYLTGPELIQKIAKLNRIERKLLPKVAERYAKHCSTAFDMFNVIVPPNPMVVPKTDKKTRMIADHGLTYIIKTFRAICIHLRPNSAVQNITTIAKTVAQRESSCKVSLNIQMPGELALIADVLGKVEVDELLFQSSFLMPNCTSLLGPMLVATNHLSLNGVTCLC
jgi:hypothetical protein